MEYNFLFLHIIRVYLVNQVTHDLGRKVVLVIEAIELYANWALLFRDEFEWDSFLSWVITIKPGKLRSGFHKFDWKSLSSDHASTKNITFGLAHSYIKDD